ncbi:MAG: alpha/beta hydrolase [Deltaproteobacteria bacterium]|nr:alpha/beta hydrolase [Deltaproteobacteria bacterium]
MEEHRVRTDDGWLIHLRRFNNGKEPVLFVHGMGANSANFQLNERYCMARLVSQKGYDSWIIELRGRGLSQHSGQGRNDWNFEDFLHRDIRTTINFIKAKTKQPLHWVGHSMGGILGIAYAQCYKPEDLASLVLFGTPLAFDHSQWMLKIWGTLAQVHRFLPTMDQEAWGRRMLPIMKNNRKSLKFFLRYLANPDNIDMDTVMDIFAKMVTNESSSITLQFSDWVRSGQIRSLDKKYSYTDNLAQVQVPALFISGVTDLMAPSRGISKHIGRLGSSKKVEQIILSKKNGFVTDYGHGDLVMGKRSPEEVYPLVGDWFRSAGD